MLYHAGEMMLSTVGQFLHGEVNDGYICRDLKSPIGAGYILLLIHDRSCIRTMLGLFENSERKSFEVEQQYPLCFTQNEQLGLVFRYTAERDLYMFAPGQLLTLFVRETVCINLVMECISSTLPFPVLYLILTQNCIHLEKDQSVYLLPKLDLAELDPAIEETDCATKCAEIVLELLSGQQRNRRNKKLKSFELICKKLDRRKYIGLPELYQDIRVTAVRQKKQGFISRCKDFWAIYHDRIFRIFLVVCIVAVVLSLTFVISQIVFGDIPLFRLFERSFEVIGTEILR